MENKDFDIIIIGNGLIGSAAAKYLSYSQKRIAVTGPREDKNGDKQIVYASHYDQARIQRLIGKDDVWTSLNKAAVKAYPALQAQSGINFHTPVGCLYVNPYGKDGYLLNAHSVAADHQLTYNYFEDKDSLNNTFTSFSFPEGSQGLLEKAPAGSINPRLLLEAQAEVFKQNNGYTFNDTVKEVITTKDRFLITSYEGSTYTAGKVLVAAGSFINFFKLPSPQLKLIIKGEVILLARLEEANALKLSEMPSLLYEIDNENTQGIYLVRPVQYADGCWYIKMGCNLPGDVYFTTLKEAQDWFETGDSDQFLPVLIEALHAIMPGIKPVGYLTKRCIISRSAYGRPYIGESSVPGLFLAWGCNGYSAMCSDAIGQVAASVVTSGIVSSGYNEGDFELVYG